MVDEVMRHLITPTEWAVRNGVGYITAMRRIKDGAVPFVKIGSVTYVIADKPRAKKGAKKPAQVSPSRGTRLPDGYRPPVEVIQQMQGEIPSVSREAWLHEHEKFKDYWKSMPGQRGVKLDWDATWRNWMRKAFGHRVVESGRRTNDDKIQELMDMDING